MLPCGAARRSLARLHGATSPWCSTRVSLLRGGARGVVIRSWLRTRCWVHPAWPAASRPSARSAAQRDLVLGGRDGTVVPSGTRVPARGRRSEEATGVARAVEQDQVGPWTSAIVDGSGVQNAGSCPEWPETGPRRRRRRSARRSAAATLACRRRRGPLARARGSWPPAARSASCRRSGQSDPVTAPRGRRLSVAARRPRPHRARSGTPQRPRPSPARYASTGGTSSLILEPALPAGASHASPLERLQSHEWHHTVTTGCQLGASAEAPRHFTGTEGNCLTRRRTENEVGCPKQGRFPMESLGPVRANRRHADRAGRMGTVRLNGETSHAPFSPSGGEGVGARGSGGRRGR